MMMMIANMLTHIPQLTEGQVEWVPLNSTYDVVTIGYGDDRKDYPVVKGIEDFRSVLKKTFPSEHDAIDKYFELVNTVGEKLFMDYYFLDCDVLCTLALPFQASRTG